jgi:hypothetical protein
LHWSEKLGIWDLTDENEAALADQMLAHMLGDGVAFLDGLRSPLDFAEKYTGWSNSEDVCAFALLLAGEREAGRAALQEAHQKELALVLQGMSLEPLGGTTAMLAALDDSPGKAVELLATWRETTIRQLGLPRDAIAKL